MSFLPDSILHHLYGLPPPSRKRTEPMQVLAVGISRSGTDSLREALHILGYEHTYHGFDSILPPSSLEATYRLLRRKYTAPLAENPPPSLNTSSSPGLNSSTELTAEDFDSVLGHCVGVSDLTAAVFAPELIAAYPEAKVILNVRRDLDAWYRSMQRTMGYFDTNPVDWAWVLSWFDAELFWIRQTMCRTMMPRFFRGSFAENGKAVYEEHVEMVRGVAAGLGLGEERFLEWSVEDGWEPLCRFLGKDVPGREFPRGNLPGEWAERIQRTMEGHERRAMRNMVAFGTVVVMVVAIVVGCVA